MGCGASSPDELLVARLAAGDDEALVEVWERHAPLVYGLACRAIGDPSAAEDIAQEVFVALWRDPERFDTTRGSLRTYLGIQAQMRAIDLVRSNGRRTAREERHIFLESALGRGETNPYDRVLFADEVRCAIEKLPEDQRSAVELAFFEGLTYREVARKLAIPEGTAKSRLRLALAKLESLLNMSLS